MSPLALSQANHYVLAQALQVIFDAQARDVFSRLDLDEPWPDTTTWITALANVARPILLRYWQEGLIAQRQKRPQKRFGVSFDLFDPRVLDAVDEAVLDFCRSTQETATLEAEEARKEVRRLLREGLPRGDAIRLLASKVREIYADPYRAFRIAATETSRAMHGGQLMAMKENPTVHKKQWLASSDACALCLELDGQERDLDEPFVVDGRGSYARIMTPPRHPHCFCDMVEVL